MSCSKLKKPKKSPRLCVICFLQLGRCGLDLACFSYKRSVKKYIPRTGILTSLQVSQELQELLLIHLERTPRLLDTFEIGNINYERVATNNKFFFTSHLFTKDGFSQEKSLVNDAPALSADVFPEFDRNKLHIT
jgi:hypothetical protein